MNKNLDDAVAGVSKIDALLYAMEGALQDIGEPYEMKRVNRFSNLFYVLVDEFDILKDSIERLEGDSIVVDVIRAAKESREILEP